MSIEPPQNPGGNPQSAGSADWSDRNLHFVGIGGASMSGLALIAKRLGAQVSGSDRTDGPYTHLLLEAGITPVIGHAAANVPDGAVVVYSSAVAADNPERVAATPDRGGGGELHRSELLAQLTELKRCLAVSGAAGKTTTTSMLVHILRECGMDPAYAVGAELRDTGLNAAWGDGEWMVIEADESDRSFLNYTPEIAVFTNCELDHHATYSSRLDLEAAFAEFTGRARTAVVWDRPDLLRIASGAGEVLAYDAEEPVLTPAGASFNWRGHRVQLAVPGLHNAINAAGALTAAASAGADPERAIAAISTFTGAKRRMERLGRATSGAWIYDDYAHHPAKVAAAVAGARTLEPKRLVIAFQPHLYSRTRALAREFGEALAPADIVVVTGIYPARERGEDFPGVDGHMVAAAVADASPAAPGSSEAGSQAAVAWMPSLDDTRAYLQMTLRDGDLCVLMGAGNVNTIGVELLAGHGDVDV
jgi:UDP-N-acetylmuramate--alanine ligase